MYYGNHGDAASLYQHTDRIGNIRGDPAGRITRLGVHTQHVAALEGFIYRLDKV